MTVRVRLFGALILSAIASASSASLASARAPHPALPQSQSSYLSAKAAAEDAYTRFRQEQRVAPAATTTQPAAVLAPGLNQPGLDASDSGGSTPPDTTGAIGPDHYVEFVNSRIAVYGRSSLQAPVATLDESTFVGTGDDTCDAQIQWDQQAQRWLYAALDCGAPVGGEMLFYGWSKTADPAAMPTDASSVSSGNWCRFRYSSRYTLEDYPKLGHDDTQIIIGANKFSDTTGAYKGSHVLVFDKPAADDQSCATPATPVSITTGFTPVPANLADSSPTGYVASAPSSAGTQLKLYTIGRSGSSSALLATTSVTVPAFSVPTNVPQPGTGDLIDSSDMRLTQAVGVTDPSTHTEGIWTQHTIAGAGGGPAMVRWYELTPGATTPRQSGTVTGPSGTFAFNGAISPTADGTGAVVFYNSGDATHLVDLRAQHRDASTPLGTTGGDIQLAQSPYPDEDFSCVSPYGPPCRWGDYAGASPDPVVAGRVWGTGELTALAPAGGTAQWGTQNAAVDAKPLPSATTGAATNITATSATLTGTVNPSGSAATYHFEYGATASYGNRTTETPAGADASAHPVSAVLTGLAAHTTFHYRLVATSAAGTATSSDRTFTTADPLPPSVLITAPMSGGVYLLGQVVRTSFRCTEGDGGPGLTACIDINNFTGSGGYLDTSTVGAQTYVVATLSADAQRASATITYTVVPKAAVKIVRTTPLARAQRVRATLACSGGLPGGACRGKLTFTTRAGRKAIVLGSSPYSIPTGTQRTITVRLARRAHVLLQRAPHHRLTVRAVATLPGARDVARTFSLIR
jgi:hypothetical protein